MAITHVIDEGEGGAASLSSEGGSFGEDLSGEGMDPSAVQGRGGLDPSVQGYLRRHSSVEADLKRKREARRRLSEEIQETGKKAIRARERDRDELVRSSLSPLVREFARRAGSDPGKVADLVSRLRLVLKEEGMSGRVLDLLLGAVPGNGAGGGVGAGEAGDAEDAGGAGGSGGLGGAGGVSVGSGL